MPEIDQGPTSGPKAVGLRIQDLIGLVFGYGLATLLVRTFGDELDALSTEEFVALVLLYVWLGLVMSGPLILLLDQRGPAAPSPIPTTHPPSRYSGEELAWLGIGVYFIALTLFVVPAPLHRKTPWFLILVVQVIVAVVLFAWLMVDRQKRARNPPSRPRWTRRAAGVILLTWPVAWILLVLLLR